MIKILLALLFYSTIIHANHIHWLGDYDKAHVLAQKEHKALMVLLVKKPCNLCNQTIQKLFMNQPYIDPLNKKFIPVILTYGGAENYPIEMYYSSTFPTLFFVNSNDESFLTTPLYGKQIQAKTIQKMLDE